MITSIKRNDSENGLDQMFDYSAQDVENTNTIEVFGSGNLPLAIKEFEDIPLSNNSLYLIKTELTLTPTEINAFVQSIKKYCNCKQDYDGYSWKAGVYIGKLIHNSNYEGNQNFPINTKNCKINYLAAELCSIDYKPIKILIDGDVGYRFGYKSNDIAVKINGDANQEFGVFSTNLSVVIDGNVNSKFGEYSTNLTALITKDAGENFAYNSSFLSAIVKGNTISLGPRTSDLTAFTHHEGQGDNDDERMTFHSEKDVVNHPKYKKIIKKLEESGLL
jgi:hypothetical protein